MLNRWFSIEWDERIPRWLQPVLTPFLVAYGFIGLVWLKVFNPGWFGKPPEEQ